MNKHSNGKRLSVSKGILLLLAAVITALAVAVTCAVVTTSPTKKVSVDNAAEQADVTTSANYSNVTGTGIQTYINNGTFTNGNYIDYSYNGSYYTVTIPQGTWKWELWGARGGYTGSYAANSGNANGAYGGYVAAQVTYTSATTIYIYCGGVGAGGTGSIDGSHVARAGGYNGGGTGIGRAGSGGGGATDIRTTSGTANNSTSYNTRKLVAAGGGGGTGATTHSQYAIYQGASGCTSRHRSSYYNDEGGGGGGYYGGATIHADDGINGYSGSNYIISGYSSISNALNNSGASGNGKARLTAVSINQAPVTLNYNLNSGKVRGTTNISIAASSIAKDNDYANYSGGAANKVYFTNGTTSNFDTIPAANAGLFMNSALSINASKYMTYSWTNSTLTIKTITMLPRSGVDGQTANNKFTLYTKVRDGFGSTTSRGVATISFTVTVNDNAITAKASYYVNNQYKFGNPTESGTYDSSKNYSSNYADGKIYNPIGTGANYKTIFIPKPLSPTDTTGYTVNAADIMTDADTAYDKVGFKTITAYTGYTSYSAYYSLTLNSNSTYATGIFPSFTLKSTGVRPTGAPFVVMSIVAQTSETNSKAQIGGTITLYLVFQISNTRPYFGSTNALATKLAEPVVSIAPGASKQLKLNSFIYDMDDGATLKATFATGASDLKVPTNEWIQVDMQNVVVPLATNVGSNYASYVTAANVNKNANTLSSKTGEGITATHFIASSVAPNGGSGAASANVTYRYVDSQTIEFTGRTATVNQYRTANGATDSSRKGHFYVLVRVIDPSDPSDNGIWFPIAIEVTSQTPTEPTTFANVTVGFGDFRQGTENSAATSGKETPDIAYFTPIGYLDSAGSLIGIGVSSTDSGAAQPFAFDKDAFLTGGALNDWAFINGATESAAILDNGPNETGSFFTVSLQTLTAPKSYFARIPDGELPLYGITVNGATCSFNGLKITPLRSTNGEYYQFRVNVKDLHGKTAAISICVKVENRALSPRLDPRGTQHRINTLAQRKEAGVTPYGEYDDNPSLGRAVTNYTIEVMDELQITPYDFAYDFDIDPNGTVINASSFNSNPYDSTFAGTADSILRTYNIAHTAAPATSASQKTASAVKAQVLSFANEENIRAYGAQYGNYISITTEPTSGFGVTKDIPSIRITGMSRTTSAIVQISFGITDGFSVVTCTFTVTVLNSAPLLNTTANHPLTDSDTDRFRLNDYYTVTAQTDVSSSAVVPNIRTFTASQFAYDKDGDTPTFNSGSIKIVAYDADHTNNISHEIDPQLSGTHYFEYVFYDASAEKPGYYGCQSTQAGALYLANYVSALITKGSGGADVLQIQGLSSTELFSLPIYVEIEVSDGYRAQPMSAVLHMLINVQNSTPVFVTEGLLKTDATQTTPEQYTWLISYEVSSEIAQHRYLFNSKELYDNSPISAPENNKIYLFEDYDVEQHVILNPKEFAYIRSDSGDMIVDRDSLVAKYNNRIVDSDGSQKGITQFTQENFNTEAYRNAAIVYTPMYPNTGETDDYYRGYVEVHLLFFEKKNGTFTQKLDNVDVADCEYWAIEIVDRHTTTERWPIQFALSVKDNHHNQLLYKEPNKKVQNTDPNSSECQVYNFYFNYRQPGIQAMHTYYRTDGNAESKVLISGSVEEDNALYLVDQSNITIDDFDISQSAYRAEYPDASKKRKQEILGVVKFVDDFKYRYYERTYSVRTTENGKDIINTYATTKTYPQTRTQAGKIFTYDPITITPGSLNPEYVPMSYIALPKGAGNDTENGTHVVFANSGYSDSNGNLSSTGEVENVLDNKNYLTWSGDDLKKVYANMTLSDGVNTWPVEQNPYLTIEYITTAQYAFTGDTYLNTHRFKLGADGNRTPVTDESSGGGPINYREDKYGFAMSKKEGGPRAPGMLKLTIALKTTSRSNSESNVEMVDVEINLLDANPELKYYDFVRGQAVDAKVGSYVETTMAMTIGSSTDDCILTLERNSAIPGNGDFGKIFYVDPDSTDTLKFYMPSTIKGGLTGPEADHMFGFAGSTGLAAYFGRASGTGIDRSAYDTYDPNPNYSTFFDVSPVTGAAGSIQFIPKSKTVPHFTYPDNVTTDEQKAAFRSAYYTKYHLMVDETQGSFYENKVYYPFRVLIYDDCNGSTFTEGQCIVAIIRVYIDNDPLSINSDTVKDTYSRNVSDGTTNYQGKDLYSVKLSKNVSFFVDVTSLLSDDDIVLDGSHYATRNSAAWKAITESNDESVRDQQYIRDYLVMPASGDSVKAAHPEYIDGIDYVDLTYFELRNNLGSTIANHDVPFTVAIGGSNVSDTTLVFTANYAFKQARDICFTFADSNGASVKIVFNVAYNNEAPTQNSDTFGVSTSIEISMRTGDVVYLYATDYTKFTDDEKGGFTYYNRINEIYASASVPDGGKLSARNMVSSFKYFADNYGLEGYNGNSLVLGSDDAPTTLRIIGVNYDNSALTSLRFANELTLARENNNQTGYLRLCIEAKGVISEEIEIQLADGEGKTVKVYVRINVVSTAPTAKSTDLPNGLTADGENTYAISMRYGEVLNFTLRSFMNDIDSLDTEQLDVYADMGGTQFIIDNPGTTGVISASVTQSGIGYKQVTLSAIDFINSREDRVAKVMFHVKDAHGAVSEQITFNISIRPQAVTAVVASNSSLPVTVMSYAQFIDSDNAGEPQEVAIVESGTAAKMFRDADVSAPSAQYNVEVYVLLRRAENGTMNPAVFDRNGNNNILLYSRTGGTENYGNDAEALYVYNFFDISSTEDGKTLLFTPNSATIRSGTTLGNIPLYIVLKKRYSDASTMAAVEGQMDVTVANSRLTATQNTSLNVGYPKVNEDSDILRDSNFLEFTGSKGDSLTWKLYNTDNSNLGLFYDYDMLNLTEEDGGKERIKYIDYSYSIPNETGNASNDPVLSVSYSATRQEVTITINRNVTLGQPNPNGEENRPTPVAVNIYAVDAINDVAGVTKNSADRVTVTTITVNVQNDRPEIATTGRVLICPKCGKPDHVRQTSANTATCSDCNVSFKSLDPEQLGYSVTFDNENGYVMNLSLKSGQSLNVNIADILDDADIDMDAYVMLNTGSENSLMDRTGNTLSSIRAGDEVAFGVTYHSAANKYRVTTLSYISFSCRSTTRDAVAVCNVKFRDSYIGSETSILTIRLTVGNIAPTVKDGAKTNITVMGVSPTATDEELADSYFEYSILDFITDANGDNFDPAAESNSNRAPTYTYIDEIIVYTRLDDLAANRPDLYGPSLMGETTNEETGEIEYSYSADTACMVNWVADDASHQKFRIEFLKGIFGVQKVTLRIYDSGYEDGLLEGVVGDLFELTLYITVANPLDDVEEVLDTREMVYGVTGTIYVSELLGEDNAKGYEIVDIKEIGTSYLRIYGPDGVAASADVNVGNWRIQAVTENVKTQVKVTFSAGDITRERILPINIIANKKPVLKQDYYRYTVSMLDDKANRTIKIKPTDWFTDEDAEDIMTFISPVTSSQTVKVEVLRAYESEADGGQPYIMLKFLRRGESVITVNLTDLSGRSYTYEVKVECTDAPVLSWWEDKMALIEANWMWFWIIVAAILVVLIVLIIVIVVTVKKRRMRREIEALLESETELEAEMLKLSMGPAAFPSFGYLPPTPQGGVNPGMMLGGGQSAPQQQSLQLNAGVGTPPPPPPPPPQQQPGYGAPQQPGYGAQPTQPPMGGDGFDPNNF